MLTPAQTRKLAQLFQQTDYNHDGFVERADYEQLGGRIAQYLGLQPGSPDDVARQLAPRRVLIDVWALAYTSVQTDTARVCLCNRNAPAPLGS